jgi:WS/DGAT/MGAT family acyltransferase
MKTGRLPITDSMFLFAESRETMLHVASLMPFSLPRDAPPDHFRAVVDELRGARDLKPPWNLKLSHPDTLRHPMQAWVEEKDVDVDYHVRRSALPAPGDERELGVLVSRLHSNNLDFSRPPWEMHIIEGLEGGRFAFYSKIHHALVDGYTGMKLLANSLTTDPSDLDTPLFLCKGMPARARAAEAEPAAAFDVPGLLRVARDQLGASRQIGKALLGLVSAARREHDDLVTPLKAPRSILNGPIGRNRRFATQKLEVARVRALGKKAGATVNDVVLALCGGALRRFLSELNALPGEPLVAMLPVNIRPKDDPGGGNAVAAILSSLATHLADPAARLRAITASTGAAKQQLTGLSKSAIMAYSAVLMAPAGLQMMKATSGRLRPAFNLIISNVPGPEAPHYFRGARMEAYYPVSIPTHGLALNITCTSYAGTLDFGFIGCRDTLPHLQRLAVYTGEALDELEQAVA